jgi:hypothetical protein
MLNIGSKGTGSYDPYVKYNAKAGKWTMKGPDGTEPEIQNPIFVADFANVKTGWINLLPGQPPDRVWDESLTNQAARPTEKHKRGFILRLYSKASFGGVVELSSSSMHLCAAINDLYTQYEAAKANHPGQLPVVKFTGATASKDKMGTNYKPNFVIEKWVPRPTELDAGASNVVPLQQHAATHAIATATPQQVAATIAAPAAQAVSEF